MRMAGADRVPPPNDAAGRRGAAAPGARPIRLLIVDDSATMRSLIRHALGGDGRIEIVGEAADASQARELIKALDPDILTLDVEMPGMDGLSFLGHLMRLRPMPVVMISAETRRGAGAALDALALGAVDCVGKPAGAEPGFAGLGDRIVAAARARLRRRPGNVQAPVPTDGYRWNGRYVLIGASTGGVEALETLLAGLPENGPPVLITQHMPAAFLERFATRLNARARLRVKLAADGMPIRQGCAFLAPGGRMHLTLAPGEPPECRLREATAGAGYCPSVDEMFLSALPVAERSVAVILTGMGRDGAEGMRRLRRAGAECLAQDADSSVIFGMPRAALANGGAREAVPLGDMAARIRGLTAAPRHPPDGPRAA